MNILKQVLKRALRNIDKGIGLVFGIDIDFDSELRAQKRKQEQARAKAQMMARYSHGMDAQYAWQESEGGGISFKIRDEYYIMTADNPPTGRCKTSGRRKLRESRRRNQPPVAPNVVICLIPSGGDTNHFHAPVNQVANTMSNNIKKRGRE